MEAIAPEHRYLTVDEYLAFELDSPVKHEWVDGAVFAMTGASIPHNLVKDNISRVAGGLPHGPACRITTSDTKVRTNRAVYYPDVVVACGPLGPNLYVEEAPCLLVEVLSPSTSSIDLREKLTEYRALASLQDYLVVEPNVRKVEWHHRGVSGWESTTVIGNGELELSCLGGAITLDDIYRGVPTADAG